MEVNFTIINLRVFLKENKIEMYSTFNEESCFRKIYEDLTK